MDHLDKQIIKALESTMYVDEVRRAAYDLIMRQRRQIEGLEMRIDALNDTNRILMETENAAVKCFAERLKEKLSFYDWEIVDGLVREMTEVHHD